MLRINALIAGMVVLSSSGWAAEHTPSTIIPEVEGAKREAIAQSVAVWRSTHPSALGTKALTSLAPLTAPAPVTGLPPDISVVTNDAPTAGVPAWNRVELSVGSRTSGAVQVYESDPALGGVNLSAKFTLSGTTESWTVNGFYDGSSWKIRFAPDAVGTWTYTVSDGTATSVPASFSCVASSGKHGWARISGTNLRFSDGTPFYGVGHNSGWLYDVETPAMSVMRSNGENCLSFWMASPWATVAADPANPNALVLPARAPLETTLGGIGNYNQSACAYLDGVIGNAENAGIYLVPSIWAHDELQDASSAWGSRDWSNNAYSTICPNGVSDFFKTQSVTGDTTSWRAQKNRYRYILSRWGYSTAIVGWVGLVELDGVLPGTGSSTYASASADATAWCSSVRSYFATHDAFRTSAGLYPFVVTKTDEASSDAVTFPKFLDLQACDEYLSKKTNYNGTTQGPATVIANEDDQMLTTGKPCFHTEFGGEISSSSTATQPIHLHNGLWAGLCSGNAMSPLLWTDGGQYPLLDPSTPVGQNMLNHYSYLSTFVRALPLLGDPQLVKASPTYTVGGLSGWGRRMGGSANNWGFVWTQSTTGSNITGGTLRQTGLVAGKYTVEWYNPYSGSRVGPSTLVSTTTVNIGTQRKPVYQVRLNLPIPNAGVADLAVRFGIDASKVPTIVPLASTLALSVQAKSSAATEESVSATSASDDTASSCGLGSGAIALVMTLTLLLRLRSAKQ